MDWVTDLLKHLQISKSVVVAIFVTAVVMVFGHQFYPATVPQVPDPWGPALFAAMILTGTLLLIWGASHTWQLVSSLVHSSRKLGKTPKLNESHFSLLLLLGQNPLESLDIDRLDYQESEVSKLEVIQLVEELEQNSLVSINPYHRSLITLTPEGREEALKIQKQYA
jgi:hypothetical protein